MPVTTDRDRRRIGASWDALSGFRVRLFSSQSMDCLTKVALPLVVTRLSLLLVGYLSLHLLRYDVHLSGPWEISASGATVGVEGRPFGFDFPVVNILSRWDAGWYCSVARDGYSFTPGQQSNVAFLPLFPVLMRAMHAVVPSDTSASWYLCGILTANAALLVGLIWLYKLVSMECDPAVAATTVLYILTFPTTLFLSAVYSESTFLAAAVGSLYYARCGRWWLSGALAAAASLTRIQGLLVVIPLFVELCMQRPWTRWKIAAGLAAISLAPLAVGCFLLYLKQRFGNAFVTRDAQLAWGGRSSGLTPLWTTVADFLRGPIVLHNGGYSLIDFLFACLFGVLIVILAIKARPLYAVYCAALFLFTTAWGSFGGMCRYVIVLFPAFVVLAVITKRDAAQKLYLAASSSFAAIAIVLFTHWRWVG